MQYPQPPQQPGYGGYPQQQGYGQGYAYAYNANAPPQFAQTQYMQQPIPQQQMQQPMQRQAPQFAQVANPQEQQKLTQWFQFADTDRSGAIDSKELVQALARGNATISPRTATLLIRMYDTDRDGNINFVEFCQLWTFIQQSQRVFHSLDLDRSGGLDANEVHSGLMQQGFCLSPVSTQSMMKIFDSANTGQLTYGQFLDLCAWLGLARSVFSWLDPQQRGAVPMDFSLWITAASSMMS
eukprot:gnl/Trimastix_PCT/2912.p1 GENE.gnl/Trimastix_PCT/2912~~gnl/Trimastix_PCT/2912.p1  ORF type:complete len:239 (+),score=35.46 gnl/Trimastix_PCT/2912:84-800(+)